MYSGQLTPPSIDWLDEDFSTTINDFSTTGAYPSTQWAQASMATPTKTPPSSPQIIGGPRLIPRVRMQDRLTEPTVGPMRQRSHSTGYTAKPHQQAYPSASFTHSFGPSTPMQMISPASIPSPCPSSFGPELSSVATPSRRPVTTHSRSISTSAIPRHSRHLSNSNIDSSVLTRYGFPTYRNMPGGSHGGTPQVATALNFLTPMSMPGPVSSVASITSTRQNTPARQTTPVAQASPAQPLSATPSRLPAELTYDPTKQDIPVSTLLEYLTAPNPTPSLVQRIVEPARGQNSHFWFDIRNLRSWSDFNTKTITETPGLLELLQCEIPTSALPTPGHTNNIPESQPQLHELCRDHYAIKVNAALNVSLGSTSLIMRSLNPNSSNLSSRTQPEFLSNYPFDAEKPVTTDRSQRGRVVGIVLCYDQWNSGMRAETPIQHCRYLAGLSHLHRFMREHGTRYGFIITEIEVVCVRYGGAVVSDTLGRAPVPNFGFLELSDPVRISEVGNRGPGAEGGGLRMTAAMALWYLHMLAKEEALPGQEHWRLDVSGPAACTRRKHLGRDGWMPKPSVWEVREARRNRGWVWPEEALNKRECRKGGKGRRVVASKSGGEV